MTEESLVTLAHAFTASHIDYRNSIIYNLTDYNINCLQWFANGTLETNFKALPGTYEFINGVAPGYMHELFSIKWSSKKSDHLNTLLKS